MIVLEPTLLVLEPTLYIYIYNFFFAATRISLMRQTPRIRTLLSKKKIHCMRYVTSVIIRLKNVNECLHETLST